MANRKPMAWTDKGLRNLKPEAQPYEQGFIGMRGFHVRVFPNGRKTARFQYVLNGKRYRMVLGHFPTDSAKKLRDCMARRGRIELEVSIWSNSASAKLKKSWPARKKLHG